MPSTHHSRHSCAGHVGHPPSLAIPLSPCSFVHCTLDESFLRRFHLPNVHTLPPFNEFLSSEVLLLMAEPATTRQMEFPPPCPVAKYASKKCHHVMVLSRPFRTIWNTNLRNIQCPDICMVSNAFVWLSTCSSIASDWLFWFELWILDWFGWDAVLDADIFVWGVCQFLSFWLYCGTSLLWTHWDHINALNKEISFL